MSIKMNHLEAQNYNMLKDKFVSYWVSNQISEMKVKERDKAFLLYIKGFVDGVEFIDKMDKQLKEKN